MENLPHLPYGITSLTVDNGNNLTGLTGLPTSILSVSIIDCEKLKIYDLPPTVKILHIELKNSPFVHTILEGIEHLKLCYCLVLGLPESVLSLEVMGRSIESLTSVP